MMSSKSQVFPSATDLIILSGKTQKGRNRIREWGNRWWAVGGIVTRVFFPNPGIGPWVMIRSTRDGDGLSSRWLALGDDLDFSIKLEDGKNE